MSNIKLFKEQRKSRRYISGLKEIITSFISQNFYGRSDILLRKYFPWL